ncbi:MAG: hypothetical protein Q4D58_03785 [Synergistaceae bacterium]|nr:hypothetical protein [Synergistaceae bacterium]
MDLSLFLADDHTAISRNDIRECRLPLENFDVRRMWQSYYAKKPAMKKAFEQFTEDWNNRWQHLPRPQAGIISWKREELEKDFAVHFQNGALRQKLRESCLCGYAAVWTIGGELEEKAFNVIKKSAMQAMFLDIAGTLLLAMIRNEIRRFLTSEAFCGDEAFVLIGEYIPELCHDNGSDVEIDPRLALLVEPWTRTDSERRPVFSLHNSGVMYPLKTQCSMFFVGKEGTSEHLAFNTVPCSNCAGKKCLAAQFNGCHLPRECQPWLNIERIS